MFLVMEVIQFSSDGSDSMFLVINGSDSMFLVVEVIQCF